MSESASQRTLDSEASPVSSASVPTPQAANTGVAARVWWILAGLVAALVAIDLPILLRMIDHWSVDPNYSHGFLIVPLAAYFAWQSRGKILRAPVEGSWWGLLPLGTSLAMLAVGRFGVELMNMRASFVLALMGLVLLLLGRQIFRILSFPLAFLLLMVPLPQSLVNVVAFPLQLIAADWAVRVLQIFGFPVLREGNILHLPNTTLFVAEACSGLRSLMALLTLGVVFAYFFRRNWVERTLLVVSTIPIAILVNAGRVTLTGVLAFHWGPAAADGAIHEFQGLITFGAAFALLLLEARALGALRRVRHRREAAAT